MSTTLWKGISLAALLSSGALTTGCFQLDTAPGKFRCDNPGDACPAGQACVDGLCQARADREGADLASAPGPSVDAAPGAAAGCRGAGALLARGGSAEVYACRGSFAAGQFAGLCGAGYRPCGAADEAVLSLLDLEGRCVGLTGFYAAQVEGALADGALQCRVAQGAEQAVLLGCGVESGTTRETLTATLATSCRKLHVALPCDRSGAAWSCTSRLQDAANSDGNKGGVLCCKG